MKISELPVQADHKPAVKEIHVLWMTTGLGCDGDSVSVTAASLPSIEDVVMGAIPGLPKVHLHNPVLAYEVGDDFMKWWHQAAEGRLEPFVLVLEGSVPNEKLNKEGYWAAMGTDSKTGQPITTNEWIDRLAPKATAIICAGTCATYGGIHAMEGNPTGAMGLADYLGWNWKSKAGLPIVNVPGCPVQPDNMMETLLYLLYQVAGLAPVIPLDDQLRPTLKSLNPFEGEFYRETLQVSRMTREMFCLMEGRHVHPSTLYPGGVGTVPSIQVFTDYLVRLMKYVEFMKKVVPLHDDLFDFFYEALPGYEKVGERRVLPGCWGSFQDPSVCDYNYKTMDAWGKKMFVTPGVVVDGKLVTTNLVDINLGIRILLGSSFYEDWAESGEVFVKNDPLGNPVDKRHPWNQTTIPKPQKRNFHDKYTWVMSPRWFDKRTGDHLALDTGGGPIARLWATALAGLVDIGYVKATGNSVKIRLPKTVLKPEVEFEWKIPKWSNAIERDRARTYFQAYAAAVGLYCVEQALKEVHAGRTETFTPFKVPDEAIGCGFHEAVRGVLSHHLVIRNKKVANYHPYPPTPWNANPRDTYGTPGPYEDAVQNTPIFEENGPDNFKGIDIMRAVRSFDPCLPCGVHMYLGNGKVLKEMHTPTALLGLAKQQAG